MKNRWFIISYRMIFGLAVIIAITTQFIYTSQKPNFNPVNFFSFFTILCNSLAALIFIVSGLGLLVERKPIRLFDVLRGASTSYMIIVGIVFSLLLADLEERLQVTLPWVNSLVHYIMPVVVALDWFIVPPKNKMNLRQAFIWLIFPIVYFSYCLIRGSITGWYPYPFLDPTHAGGYQGLFLYFSSIILGMIILNRLLIIRSKKTK